MSELIMQLSDIMRAEVKSLDTAAHNAANIATPGFRSERAVLDGAVFKNKLGTNQPHALQHTISMKDGPLNVSGNTTDMAIRGNGWFVLETASGALLTRDGRFRLDANGTLVDRSGNAVATDSGTSQGLSGEFRLAADGTLLNDNKPVAKLRLVQTPDIELLSSKGNGFYQYQGELQPASNAVVVQGAYETSNVDTASDMLHLMRTTRHIETLQRSMSAYDQLLNTGINQLGK